jgi:hypothetical protein
MSMVRRDRSHARMPRLDQMICSAEGRNHHWAQLIRTKDPVYFGNAPAECSACLGSHQDCDAVADCSVCLRLNRPVCGPHSVYYLTNHLIESMSHSSHSLLTSLGSGAGPTCHVVSSWWCRLVTVATWVRRWLRSTARTRPGRRTCITNKARLIHIRSGQVNPHLKITVHCDMDCSLADAPHKS